MKVDTRKRVEIINYQDNWQDVKDAAMNTIGKDSGKYPSSEWKRKILLAEHSPIRLLEFTFVIHDLPYWVSVHIVRHWLGILHFVSTQRTDRTGVARDNLPQGALVTHRIRANAQALINISRKRLCTQASLETRQVWGEVIDCLAEYEPEIASVCVPECVYRGFCPEMKPCGYSDSEAYLHRKTAYQKWNPSKEKCCESCSHFRQDNGVCTNEKSEHVLDYVAKDFVCTKWGKKDG